MLLYLLQKGIKRERAYESIASIASIPLQTLKTLNTLGLTPSYHFCKIQALF